MPSSLLDDVDQLLAAPIVSSIPTRWERKQSQAQIQPSQPSLALSALTPSNAAQSVATPIKTPRRPSLSSASKTPSGKPANYGDRFIPNRESLNKPFAHHSVAGNENANPADEAANGSAAGFQSHLAQSLFQGEDFSSKILTFKAKPPKPTEGFSSNLRVLYTQNRESSAAAPAVKSRQRVIPQNAERILDAPELTDDYYLNLLDWSNNNYLAIALGRSVYTWDPSSGSIDLLCECKSEDDSITSVQWMQDGSHIAVATKYQNDVQLWSVEAKKQVRSMKGHLARVGSLAWNSHVLSSGSRDSMIFHHDVRIAQHHVATLKGHQQEICGLKWSPDGLQLASGGNDNLCCIWDINAHTPKYTFTDACAAVKALAWAPFQKNLLATGAGTADRHIRFYNTATGQLENKIDTNSQVCSLQWSKTERELLSAHGFSQNQLSVWKYPTLVKIADLTGHTSRVLHTAISADGSTVCSAAADETLRFWRVWDPITAKKKAPAVNDSLGQGTASGAQRSRMNLNIR